jgi:hypothetical protein
MRRRAMGEGAFVFVVRRRPFHVGKRFARALFCRALSLITVRATFVSPSTVSKLEGARVFSGDCGVAD